jgi:hypothetical protein
VKLGRKKVEAVEEDVEESVESIEEESKMALVFKALTP